MKMYPSHLSAKVDETRNVKFDYVSFRCVVVNIRDWDVVVSEFECQSLNCIQFGLIPLGNVCIPLYPQLRVKLFHQCKQAKAARAGWQPEGQSEECVGVMKSYMHRYLQNNGQSDTVTQSVVSDCPEVRSGRSAKWGPEYGISTWVKKRSIWPSSESSASLCPCFRISHTLTEVSTLRKNNLYLRKKA